MKALQIDRSLYRFATARVASGLRAGSGGRRGPLRLTDVDPPVPPDGDWELLKPRLSGICGSDLATVEGRSSRWFEPIVSFPFVPGHEVVADAADGRRVVIEPVLHCAIRGVEPACGPCLTGRTNHCEHLTSGHLHPGLQTGYCSDTGGGWSLGLMAHRLQIHAVPEEFSDEAAVMIEPVACAVHGVLSAPPGEGLSAVVIGAGTIGLAAVAAAHRYRPDISTLLAIAKHPEQRNWAKELGAGAVATPDELRRAVRRSTGSWILDNGQLTGGADIVYDCVGSADSLAGSLAVVRPGGTVVLMGMPGHVGIDLTGLWQREIRLTGAYAYGPEPAAGGRHSFDLAMELTAAADLGRLVSAAYPLDRYAEAIEHAASAGRRGSVKIVFDLRQEKRR